MKLVDGRDHLQIAADLSQSVVARVYPVREDIVRKMQAVQLLSHDLPALASGENFGLLQWVALDRPARSRQSKIQTGLWTR